MSATQYFANPKNRDEVLANVYDPVTNQLSYRAFYVAPTIQNPKNADEVYIAVYDPISNTIA